MIEQGTDHVWLDATGLEHFAERFPTINADLAAAGLDPRTDWLPVAPAAHHQCGGIVTDLSGATSLPGLWAAGETSCSGVHGANRLASNSLLEGMVFGPRAIEAVADGVRGPRRSGAMRAVLGFDADDPSTMRIGGVQLEVPMSSTATATHEPGDAEIAALRARLQQAMSTEAGVQRHRDAVAGGDRGVGRDGEELPGAAGGEQHVARPHVVHLSVGGDRAHARALAVLEDQVEGEGVLVQHRGGQADRGDQGTLDLRSRGGPARVHHACDRVPALPRQLQVAAFVAVELGAERDQLLDAARALVHQHADRVDVAQPGACGDRVGEVQVDLLRVARQRRGDAPLRPACGREVETALGDDAGAQSVGLGGLHRGGQAGDAGAEHEQVELVVGHEADPPLPPGAAARLSMSRAPLKRTAPKSRTGPATSSTATSVSGSATST